MDNELIFAVNDVVGDAPAAQTTTTQQQTSTSTEVAPVTTGSTMGMYAQLIFTMVAVFAIMYFFTIRPQRKREKEIKEIQDSLKTGDWVITFSGMYGKIVDIGPEIVMVEFGSNKSVRIPIRKSEVTKSKEPSLIAKSEDEGK